MSTQVGDLVFMLFLATVVITMAAVSYYLLSRRDSGHTARHRATGIGQPPEFWRMKARACESQWSDKRQEPPMAA